MQPEPFTRRLGIDLEIVGPTRRSILQESRPATQILILVRTLAGLGNGPASRTRGGSEIPPAPEPLGAPLPRIHSMSLTESPTLPSGRSRDLSEAEGPGEAEGTWLRSAGLHLVCIAILVGASVLAYCFVTPRWKTT